MSWYIRVKWVYKGRGRRRAWGGICGTIWFPFSDYREGIQRTNLSFPLPSAPSPHMLVHKPVGFLWPASHMDYWYGLISWIWVLNMVLMNELQDIDNPQITCNDVCVCISWETIIAFIRFSKGSLIPERIRTSALGFESWVNSKKSSSWHLLGSDHVPGTTNCFACIISFESPNPAEDVLWLSFSCWGGSGGTESSTLDRCDAVCWSRDFSTVWF